MNVLPALGMHNDTGLLEHVRQALQSPYQGYAYAYPHKKTYRPIAPALPLGQVWENEQRHDIGVYVHIPFCEMRCGFCNLFATTNAAADRVETYMAALIREARAVCDEVGTVQPQSLTIGGGTPTYLNGRDLARLLELMAGLFNAEPRDTTTAIETSPGTATPERMALLASYGVSRISIGVQSFVEDEMRALGRPQRVRESTAALDCIRSHAFRTLNIDLMYGMAGQTPSSLEHSLRQALAWKPEEIFLYPLYVRPLTGLDGRARTFDEHRQKLYETGRALLASEGYMQRSMRMFVHERQAGTESGGSAYGEAGPVDRAVIGLGCGARSRVSDMHYSKEYAVERRAVLSIVEDYCSRSSSRFAVADYGVALNFGEQARRRIVLDSITANGLDIEDFIATYGGEPASHIAEIAPLIELGYLQRTATHLKATPKGLAVADAIGPLLISPAMEMRMAAYTLR